MKKIIFLCIVFLCTMSTSYAQVGIGTSTPSLSAQLDIVSQNKGVLIPRLQLESTISKAPIADTPAQSLLVFNTATTGNGTSATDVTPGVYYWHLDTATTGHWERIINQENLTTAVGNITQIQGDVTKIMELLKTVYPSNNLLDPAVGNMNLGGGMIYEPDSGTSTGTISYLYYNTTTNEYVKKDITNDIISLIKSSESKTVIMKNTNFQYYISEAYLDANNGVAPDQAVVDSWSATSFPSGVYYIDVVGGLINNFEDFVTNYPVTVGGNIYQTIEDYLNYITQNSLTDGVTRIVMDTSVNPNQAKFERWDNNSWTLVPNTAFSKIVKDNETETNVTKNNGTGAVGNEIIYTYKNELGNDENITFTADVLSTITNNDDVRNEIMKLINAGGNVYFTKIAISADSNTLQTAIPENSFYTINPTNNLKELIDISATVVNAIINASTTQKTQIKTALGDQLATGSSQITGDTFNGEIVRKGVFTTKVTANTANTTGIIF